MLYYSLQTKTCEEPFWKFVRKRGMQLCRGLTSSGGIDLEALYNFLS